MLFTGDGGSHTCGFLVSLNPFGVGCDVSPHMDGVDIAKPDDISVGVGVLPGIHFIFRLLDTENVRKALIFMRQCLFGMESNDEVTIGVIHMANFLPLNVARIDVIPITAILSAVCDYFETLYCIMLSMHMILWGPV